MGGPIVESKPQMKDFTPFALNFSKTGWARLTLAYLLTTAPINDTKQLLYADLFRLIQSNEHVFYAQFDYGAIHKGYPIFWAIF